MARKKSTVTQEELDALESAIQTLADEPAEGGDTKEYLGESGLKRLVELVADALKAKQDTLSQGDNITIEDGVISATDTGATSVGAEGTSPLTLDASYEPETRKISVTGSVDLSAYAKGDDLKGYLPLTGGTLTGTVTFDKETTFNGNMEVNDDMTFTDPSKTLHISPTMEITGDVVVKNLAENADAPSVVVADDEGKLYKAPVSQVGGGDYLPISGGTLTGAVSMGDTGFRITAEGHVELPSGVEIW